MKKALRLMVALLFLVGMANAQSVVNFDTGDFSQLNGYNFVNDASYPWTVQNIIMSSGPNYLAQSGNAGLDNTTSAFQFTITFGVDGFISFDANCMGETTNGINYDKCIFSINGEEMFSHGEEVEGWHSYGYNLPSGTYTFVWKYTKDGSDSHGNDCFQVDNIAFGPGTACVTPNAVEAYTMGSMAYIQWDGIADSYTLRYKKGSGSWTTINGITDQEYLIEDLPSGNYKVSVQSDCNPGQWVDAEFIIHNPVSWADWYGYVTSSATAEFDAKFVNFKMQDLSTVNAACTDPMDYVFVTTYVNGYVWMVKDNPAVYHPCLYKAPVNLYNKTIGDPELVSEESFNTSVMAYNPANGLIYYIDGSDSKLKSFDPASPSIITSYAVVNSVYALAIDNDGNAYVSCINMETGDYEFASMSLVNASTTTIGVWYDQMPVMYFDRQTNELFAAYGESMYYIDRSTGTLCYISDLGDVDFVSLSCMFMVYDWDAVNETEVESVNVYPNPTQGQFTVEGNGLMVITNLLGQEVLRQEVEEKATVELPSGMYIVRLNNAISKVVVE